MSCWDSGVVFLEHIFGITILCMGSGEMAWQQRAPAAVPEDPGLVLSSLFWYPLALYPGGAQTYRHTDKTLNTFLKCG